MLHCKFLKTLFFFLLPITVFTQSISPKDRDITGLWKGTLYNDTTQKTLRYEIAISKEGKKFTGYSHTYFIYEDKEYHGVKKVKIKQQNDKLLIEDDGLIAHNYPIPPNKGVRQLNVLTLTIQDDILILSGPFSTNRTKEYSVLTGNVLVQRKNDFKQSALIPHLEELGLAKNLSFVEEEKTATLVALEKEKIEVIKTAKKKKEITSTISSNNKPSVKTAPLKIDIPPVITPNITPAADVSKRKIETIQSVNFTSDSLELTLYDNGEVDGDTVSVVMNGNVIMPKVGLSTNAVRKKISTLNAGDSIQLIMYAETLGSLPPNTGLLIVYDGTERYEIRFSGDMQKSSAIVFRRKK